jgi:hypothetical protein
MNESLHYTWVCAKLGHMKTLLRQNWAILEDDDKTVILKLLRENIFIVEQYIDRRRINNQSLGKKHHALKH